MLGHLSLARPITCLISRWPNSPPESYGVVLRIVVARLYLDAGAQKMFTIWFWLRVSLAWFSSLLYFFCLPHNGSQIKNVRQPCLRLAAFHFSCWSLNCLRHDTCHKVAHTQSWTTARARARLHSERFVSNNK